MEFVCRRCEHVTPTLYRVTSEHEGAVLLDMDVCWSCAWVAKRMRLCVVKMRSAKRATRPKSLQVMADNKQQRGRLTIPIR